MSGELHPPSQFRTRRLLLRRPSPDDAERLYRTYTSDAQVTRFLTWCPHTSLEETKAYLRWCDEHWAARTRFVYIIEIQIDAGQPIGAIDLRPDGHAVSFGYVLARKHWGQGYMAEALQAAVDWALSQPGIWRA